MHQRYIEPPPGQDLIAHFERGRGAIHCSVSQERERLVELRYFRDDRILGRRVPTQTRLSMTADEAAELIEGLLDCSEIAAAFGARSLQEAL